MTSNSERSGAQIAASAAWAGKALVNIVKGASAGGLAGAATAAAREFAPELIKVLLCITITLLIIPMLLIAAIPNMFFGYDSISSPSMAEFNSRAKEIGSLYYTLSSSDKTDTDAIVTQIANAYEENGDEVKRIVVKNEPEGDDLLWFIAIYSVANEQDLRRMDSEEARKMYADRLMYSASLDGTTLEITFSKVNPEKWMRQLEFDEESKKWARALHETLSESHALDQFRDQFADATPSYSGLTGYTGEGGYEHGDSYDNEIDISGFISPETKNSHDLAAYAIQAWENNWGYVWGTFGGVLTPALFTYKLQQYPDGVGNYRDYIQENYVGRRTTDCIGLIKGYCWLDTESMMINYATNGAPDWDADSYYNYAVSVGADHGPMSTIPDIPGLGLWQNGHAGVYIGGGYAVEAIGTKFGVVKTAIANRTWSAWYKIPFIDYDTNTLSDSDF